MKIEAGKYYRAQGGDVIGPLSAVSWCDRTFSALDLTWHEDGSYVQGVPGNLDLISEVYVSDTPPVNREITDEEFWQNLKGLQRKTAAMLGSPETKTLRDEFAMAALMGIMAHPTIGFETKEEMGKEMYIVADAMMEARKK